MAYEWSIDPEEFFTERRAQMLNAGLPEADVNRVQAAVRETWIDAPGGWTYEWSSLARNYAGEGRSDLAALAYGWAKFPTLANAARRTALANQLDQYLRAAPGFPVSFERRVLDLAHQGGRTQVPMHIFAAKGLAADAPAIIVSGGVDTWKMDLHRMFVGLALTGIGRIMAFDIAGTGESAIPMTAAGGAEIVQGVIAEARALGAPKVGHFGVSMGGFYSAQSGLSGEVDAAVVLGGPVEAAFVPVRSPRPFGMSDIVGNAMGFAQRPEEAEFAARRATFSLRPLLDQDRNAPMLIVNGAEDVHVPQHDTLVFEGRRATEVQLIPGTGHCAVTKLPEVMPMMMTWLARTLTA
jgi:esterase FrsA